jgi:hypothetical protein
MRPGINTAAAAIIMNPVSIGRLLVSLWVSLNPDVSGWHQTSDPLVSAHTSDSNATISYHAC